MQSPLFSPAPIALMSVERTVASNPSDSTFIGSESMNALIRLGFVMINYFGCPAKLGKKKRKCKSWLSFECFVYS